VLITQDCVALLPWWLLDCWWPATGKSDKYN